MVDAVVVVTVEVEGRVGETRVTVDDGVADVDVGAVLNVVVELVVCLEGLDAVSNSNKDCVTKTTADKSSYERRSKSLLPVVCREIL